MSSRKSKSRRQQAPTTYTPKPSSVAKEELLKTHGFEFKILSITKTKLDHIFNVDVSNSFNNKPLTAIRCHNSEQVEECFKRSKANNPEIFSPISAYKHGDKYLVLGEFVGETFEDWVMTNQHNIWTNSSGTTQLTEMVIRVGKQLCDILTKYHQNGKFLGNIREEMCINEDSKVIFIQNYQSNNKITQFEDGVKKDLEDLKWFVNTIYDPFRTVCPNNESFALFFQLFP
ncbi:hypothetical protein RND81_13G167800 [Saponaria officinalis]|uniref:Uncharacterized protein n=1 Tax=Saponaria officinalis TaxID=3572 RepID=A0AAW1H3G5_SAPOF